MKVAKGVAALETFDSGLGFQRWLKRRSFVWEGGTAYPLRGARQKALALPEGQQHQIGPHKPEPFRTPTVVHRCRPWTRFVVNNMNQPPPVARASRNHAIREPRLQSTSVGTTPADGWSAKSLFQKCWRKSANIISFICESPAMFNFNQNTSKVFWLRIKYEQ